MFKRQKIRPLTDAEMFLPSEEMSPPDVSKLPSEQPEAKVNTSVRILTELAAEERDKLNARFTILCHTTYGPASFPFKQYNKDILSHVTTRYHGRQAFQGALELMHECGLVSRDDIHHVNYEFPDDLSILRSLYVCGNSTTYPVNTPHMTVTSPEHFATKLRANLDFALFYKLIQSVKLAKRCQYNDIDGYRWEAGAIPKGFVTFVKNLTAVDKIALIQGFRLIQLRSQESQVYLLKAEDVSPDTQEEMLAETLEPAQPVDELEQFIREHDPVGLNCIKELIEDDGAGFSPRQRAREQSKDYKPPIYGKDNLETIKGPMAQEEEEVSSLQP